MASNGAGTDGDEPVLWMMLPSLASMHRLEKLQCSRPPRFDFVNHGSVAQNAPALGRDDARWFAEMALPRLSFAQADFAPDFIWTGLYFASVRFREALGLGRDAIEYRGVEVEGPGADAARAADYRTFRVVERADPVDFLRMYGEEPERDPDGQPTLAWEMSVSGPHAPARRTVWKRGFVPPAPLFVDTRGRLVATEALAARVMGAGLGDVVFQDVTSEASAKRLVFRSGSPSDGKRAGLRCAVRR